ncbi:hypothetical protein LOK49_LG03G00050 [Camellia lanceoleosa]|uniref:Uncharacterized protein n=1 Tax=Camellia lanceoleosa TaxID=1840588 RepID=A0ACC0IDE3_9ERIC|nr:hypothetical protein LOK49_LG03G00050 [Camellia lanceoleosa]
MCRTCGGFCHTYGSDSRTCGPGWKFRDAPFCVLDALKLTRFGRNKYSASTL